MNKVIQTVEFEMIRPALRVFFPLSFPSGRVGRAGRSGTAYSLICPDEMPYVYDLHLFLGRPVQFASPEHTQGRLYCMPVR